MGRWILVAIGLLLAGATLVVARPWSDYDPWTMHTLFAPERRLQNSRHLDRVFPARPISGSPRPFAFPAAPEPLDVTYRFDGERRDLDAFLDRIAATGLVVIKDGRIVHERYFRGADRDSRFTSWSVAKSFVGTLVGIALAEGRIGSLDDPITAYVPALKDSGYAGVSIRQVLQMSAGVDFDETYDDRWSDINRFFMRIFILGQRADALMTRYGRARPPGEIFHYISINTQALGMLLRAVHDRPLPELLTDRLWHPLGARSAFWNVDRDAADGKALAFCCLNARLRDFAKLGQLYLQQGQWRGRSLLPPEWVRRATTPGGEHLVPGASPYPHGPRGYGLHWWVPAGHDREYFAAGVWGQYVYVSEPDNLVIARAAADPDYRAHTAESIATFRAIRDTLRETGDEPGG